MHVNNSRAQLFPSPVNPSKHLHMYDPRVLLHVALSLQSSSPRAHSSISVDMYIMIISSYLSVHVCMHICRYHMLTTYRFLNVRMYVCTIYIPSQGRLFSVTSYPLRLQVQRKFPTVLLHISAHPPLFSKHSLTSVHEVHVCVYVYIQH